ncbi:MAG: hypothetical protein A3K76_02385 [Euryarchaeota archaeon RBG_13_57_23]|nr:MAG: hypothetical protein A3K76_02385 [Euryarchaeota archaeon RBG_13_57_23]
MTSEKPISFKNRDEWRNWLESNHNTSLEAWLLFHKKHVSTRALEYSDAVEEGIRFGWIDGKLKRIDDRTHKIRFTPRKPNSLWSEYNRDRAEKLLREGKMTERGLAAVNAAKKNGRWAEAYSMRKPLSIPPDLISALRHNGKAWDNFRQLSKSKKYAFIFWVESAKRDETRRKRIREVASQTSKGEAHEQ